MSITYTIFLIDVSERVLRATIKRARATGECQFEEISPEKLIFKDKKNGKEFTVMIKGNQIWTIGADQIIAKCLIKYKIPFAVKFKPFATSKEAAEEFNKIK